MNLVPAISLRKTVLLSSLVTFAFMIGADYYYNPEIITESPNIVLYVLAQLGVQPMLGFFVGTVIVFIEAARVDW